MNPIIKKIKKQKEGKGTYQQPGKAKGTAEFMNRFALIFHIPLAFGISFLLEWLSRHSFYEAYLYTRYHTGAYVYNSFVIFAAFTLVFLTTHQTVFRLLIFGIFLTLGIINCIVLINRVSPFGFTDISMIGDLLTMQNTQYFTRFQAMLSVIALVIFIALLVLLFVKIKPVEHKWKLPWRILLVVVCFGSIPALTKLGQSTKYLDRYFGNLSQGYLDNGYLYGFGMSMLGRGMHRPLLYSEDKIESIVAKNTKEDTTLQGEKPNIIVVLLESYFDVSECSFLEYEEDPIAEFHKLEENYSTGHCTVPVVGAGTCNTEFEVLTGMNVQFFGPGEYPQKTILKKVDCESTADVIKKQGYSAHVVHNNGGNFYSRKNAFSQMGFDTFTSKELLDITDYTPMGTWPLDDILVGATEDALNSTEGPDYCYTITVGTHGDYPKDRIITDPQIPVKAKGKDEEKQNQWEYYVQMLHNEERFIKGLTQMLGARDEPSLVIMFGDHLPTMGLTSNEVKTKDLYKTKYITWNNFGMAKQDKDLTSFQLVSEYFDRLGIHGGTIVDYNQTKLEQQVNPGTDAYLGGLQQLQYDLLYGKRYAYTAQGKDTEPYPPSDIIMGIRDVTIDRAYSYDGKIHIYGNNFTKWSSVYLNGDKIPTTYESAQVLTVEGEALTPGDTLVVNQLGSSDTVFRSSNTYTVS